MAFDDPQSSALFLWEMSSAGDEFVFLRMSLRNRAPRIVTDGRFVKAIFWHFTWSLLFVSVYRHSREHYVNGRECAWSRLANTHRTGADILLARVDDIQYSTTAIHVRSGRLAVLILTPVPTVIPDLLRVNFITSGSNHSSSLASLKWDTIVLIFEIWAFTRHACSKCRDIGLAKFK